MNDPFIVTDHEYKELQKEFGDLEFFACWQLIRKNVKNNHTEEMDDIMQQLHMSLIRAGRYYKRQVYIEECLERAEECVEDAFVKIVIEELKYLWKNKTKHGANKQKFGPLQEKTLENIIEKYVPKHLRPDKKAPLRIDKKFRNYCKAIAWNQQKSMGRKISRERGIRSGAVSISEFSEVF